MRMQVLFYLHVLSGLQADGAWQRLPLRSPRCDDDQGEQKHRSTINYCTFHFVIPHVPYPVLMLVLAAGDTFMFYVLLKSAFAICSLQHRDCLITVMIACTCHIK